MYHVQFYCPNILISNLRFVQQQASVGSPTSLTLPNQPIPKEMLNINNGPQITTQVVQPQPLNPATILLPPSVASALQSINDKVTAKQNKVKLLGGGQHNTPTIITTTPSTIGGQSSVIVSPKQEQHQQIIIQGPSDSSSTSTNLNEGGNGPLFYYLMPGTVPYNLVSDGGATIQVKTADGSLATAQLVTVPGNSVQNVVGGGNSGSNNSSNGITLSNTSSSIPNWVMDTSSPSTSRSNTLTNASSM